MSSCSVSGQVRRVFKDAGRVCPVDYRLAPDAFAGGPEVACDVLYVVGGLYGNPFALDAVDRLVAAEQGDVRVVLNGDLHWFDKTAENFAALERRAARYTPLAGNVEAELRRQVDVGVGCGCAYPDCTGDDAVSRSNRIHKKLSEAVDAHPELKEPLAGRPATCTVGVAGRKVAVTHGDEQLIGGWACSRESLQDVLRQDELDRWMAANDVDVLATTHTCAPAALSLARGLVVNNGAAGLPNFAGQHFGLTVRVAAAPHPDALFGAERDGLHVEAVPVRYDHDAYLAWFDGLWPAASPAAVSYRSRIVDGADDRLEDALLGGFRRGPSARTDAPPRRSRATKDDVELALAGLVYFEDVVDDSSCLHTAGEPSTIQVNVTARCNLACAHCHVESGPHRTEAADRAVLEAVLAVAAGTGHTVAILEDGSLWVWGRNDQGQLGLDPDTAALVPQPTQVTEATGAVDVAAGTYQTACLLSDGTLLTWGAQRLLGSGSVEAWAETATEDTTAQVTLSQEAGWAPWAVLAGSVVCLLAAGLVTRPRRD